MTILANACTILQNTTRGRRVMIEEAKIVL
jgi:hypothetical protein